MTFSTPLFNTQQITSSGSTSLSGVTRLMGVQLVSPTGAAGAISFDDSVDGNGTPVLKISKPQNDSGLCDLTPFGGITFHTAMYATITSGSAYLWYE